jgi:hypothetical protein
MAAIVLAPTFFGSRAAMLSNSVLAASSFFCASSTLASIV